MKIATAGCPSLRTFKLVRDSSSFRRNGAKFKPQPLVLVVCEDTKSSKTYFSEASNHFRSTALVEFSHCGKTDPLGIVEGAVSRASKFERVYCVIDRDSHDAQNFSQALATAALHEKVTLLTSYPCFEFWLLLHFGYTRAPFMPAGKSSAADRVLQVLREKMGMEDYAKGSIEGLFEKLRERLADATKYANRTLLDAQQDADMNPSTPLHELIAVLQALGKPQAIDPIV
jgi:hypothetical protein